MPWALPKGVAVLLNCPNAFVYPRLCVAWRQMVDGYIVAWRIGALYSAAERTSAAARECPHHL